MEKKIMIFCSVFLVLAAINAEAIDFDLNAFNGIASRLRVYDYSFSIPPGYDLIAGAKLDSPGDVYWRTPEGEDKKLFLTGWGSYLYSEAFPSGCYSLQGEQAVLWIDENNNSIWDTGEASISKTVPDDFNKLGIVSNVSIYGGIHPTIEWDGVDRADEYHIRIGLDGPYGLGTLLFVDIIPDNGMEHFSYTYEGNLFNEYESLVVMIMANDVYEDYGSLNISQYHMHYSAPVSDPPIANAGPDQTYILGEYAVFDGTDSSDPDGYITSYAWDFGYGYYTEYGNLVEHFYTLPGNYEVRLRVMADDGDTDTDTASVTVLTPAEATQELIYDIEDLNLLRIIEERLVSRLESAIDSMEEGEANVAVNKLGIFINVEVRRWRRFIGEEADILIAAAQRIRAALQVVTGCGNVQIFSDGLSYQEKEAYCQYTVSEREKVEAFWGATWGEPIRIHVASHYLTSFALIPGYWGQRGFMAMPLDIMQWNQEALLHEIVHIYAPNRNRFLAEGLAVYLQETLGGNPAWPNPLDEDFDELAHLALSEVDSLYPLNAFRTIPPRGIDRIFYIVSGSFVEFLIEEYGLDMFRELYETDNYCNVYGKPLGVLENEWRSNFPGIILNTPTGEDVVVNPVSGSPGITVTFDQVDMAGITSVDESYGGPPPPTGFKIGQGTVYYEFVTTADYSGQIEICIRYRDIFYEREEELQLFHHENNEWVKVPTVVDPDNHTICGIVDSFSSFAIFEREVKEIDIDIKPGSVENPINLKSKGKVPVAVLTTADFDASDTNPVTVRFADAAPRCWKNKDVDADGDTDLLFYFNTRDLNLDVESTQATLIGSTFDQLPIQGSDSVKIVSFGSKCKTWRNKKCIKPRGKFWAQ